MVKKRKFSDKKTRKYFKDDKNKSAIKHKYYKKKRKKKRLTIR